MCHEFPYEEPFVGGAIVGTPAVEYAELAHTILALGFVARRLEPRLTRVDVAIFGCGEGMLARERRLDEIDWNRADLGVTPVVSGTCSFTWRIF